MIFEDQRLKACMQSNMFYGFPNYEYSKTCLKGPLKKKTKIGFQDRLSLNAGQKYCRMLQEGILQNLRPSLSYHLSSRPLICLFLSGSLRQALLYMDAVIIILKNETKQWNCSLFMTKRTFNGNV